MPHCNEPDGIGAKHVPHPPARGGEGKHVLSLQKFRDAQEDLRRQELEIAESFCNDHEQALAMFMARSGICERGGADRQ